MTERIVELSVIDMTRMTNEYLRIIASKSRRIALVKEPPIIGWAVYHLNPNEWAAFSTIVSLLAAIATFAAVVVAIMIPRGVANADREEARRVEKERRDEADRVAEAAERELSRIRQVRYHEVASATYNSLDIVICAIEHYRTGNTEEFLKSAAQAVAMSETLRIIIRGPSLTDGAIFSGAAAASALDGIARTGNSTRKVRENPNFYHVYAEAVRFDQSAIGELQASLVLAAEARARIIAVKGKHKINVRNGEEPPVLPLIVEPQ